MSDFLARLAARARGEAPLAVPRPRSRYEPGPGVPSAMPEMAQGREGWEGSRPEPEAAPSRAVPANSPAPLTSSIPSPPRAPRAPRAGEPPESSKRVSVSASSFSSMPVLAEERPGPAGPPEPPERSAARPREPLETESLPLASPPPAPPVLAAAPMPSSVPAPLPARSEAPREVPFPADWRHGRVLASPRELAAVPGRSTLEMLEMSEMSETSEASETGEGPKVSGTLERREDPAPARLPTLSPRAPDVLPPLASPEAAAPVVEVHIDRSEVRAPTRAAPARRPAPAFAPQLGLADYLKARGERRR